MSSMGMLLVRQAIYNRNMDVYAYDMMFENPKLNGEFDRKIEEKRIAFICNYGTLGLHKFTNNKKAVINFTELSLFEDIPDLLGRENIIVEISQKLEFNKKVMKAISDLKEKGFTIAFKWSNNNDIPVKLCNIVDIVVINFGNIENIGLIYSTFYRSKILITEIDNEDRYNLVKEKNIDYFVGEYFSKSTVINKKDISVRNSNRFNLIIQLLNDDINIDNIENIIKSDLSISYKLVRYLNSSTFGFMQQINSIRQAIILLGKDELRKWLTLIIVSDMQPKDQEEVTNNIIIRGRFCELVAENIIPSKKSMAFMTGIFSELNKLMDMNMEEVVADMQVDREVKWALLGKEGILKDILELVIYYEKMDVKKVELHANKLNIDKSITVSYLHLAIYLIPSQ